VEIFVSQCPAGWIEIELRHDPGGLCRRPVQFISIEFQRVAAVLEFGSRQLLQDVFVIEKPQVLRHDSTNELIQVVSPDEHKDRRVGNDQIFLIFKFDFDGGIAKEQSVVSFFGLQRHILDRIFRCGRP
jgi:hypothetical protein